MTDNHIKNLLILHVMLGDITYHNEDSLYWATVKDLALQEWNPTMDMNHAMWVLEKFKNLSFSLNYNPFSKEKPWGLYELTNKEGRVTETLVVAAETAQLAICLFALKTKGVKL